MKRCEIMRYIATVLFYLVFAIAFAGVVVAVPTIDGVFSAGEWTPYFLGTSVTGWESGMSVDVYGFVDSGFLYAAYNADITQPGWATTCALSIPPNFYYKTPIGTIYPAQGFTLFEMTYDATGSSPDITLDVQQTDGVGFVGIGTKAANGITRGWMQPAPGASCLGGLAGENIAEFKIPLSLLTYGGDDGQLNLTGQYWQYDDAPPFYVKTTEPIFREPIKDSKVAKAQPTANFGAGRYMMVNDKLWATDRSYIGFDFSNLSGNFTNSTLEVYVYQTGKLVIGSKIQAWYCFNVDFNEMTVNWNNQPAKWKTNGALQSGNCTLADSYTASNKVNSGLPETKHSWNLTDEVNQALNSTSKKFTVVLKHDTEDKSNNFAYVQYLTANYSESAYRPQLIMS